jgi:hypothetical protein
MFMNLKITPAVCALVSTSDGLLVRCNVEMVLSPYRLMPMYAAEAIEGHPFDGQRKVIVPAHRVSFVSLKNGDTRTATNAVQVQVSTT